MTITYRFGDTTVDRRTGQLLRSGRPVALEPRAFHVLCVLIEHAGELVDHETLLNVVWNGVAVTPHSLTEAISQLRRVLDDDPRHARVIETAHRRGYRFIAAVEQIRSAPPARWRLPGRLVELIGRAGDLDELVARLRTSRSITLVGPGGVGKTQLALEAGRQIEGTLDDGALWVDLAAAIAADDVARIVADAIGLPDRHRGDAIGSALRDAHALIVLDNCERAAESAGELASMILSRAPRVQILATSQRPLGAAGELLVRVPPLDCGAGGTAEASSPAARLFAVRAGAVQPAFGGGGAGADRAIAAICRRLDGLPLAIELAAAQVRVLSPGQILDLLDSRLDLLERTDAAKARYRTLADMIAWSTSLLSPSEKRLLEDVSVFPGTWDLDATSAVSTGSEAGAPTLKLLAGLVDKSLVLADTNRETARYRLLDSVRMFAQDRLALAGRGADARDRMLRYYSNLAAQAEREWYTPRGAAWLDWLHDNLVGIRVALQWSLSGETRAVAGLEIVVNLRWSWRAGGYFAEAHRWLERLIATTSDVPPALRARAEIAMAEFSLATAHYEVTHALIEGVVPTLASDSPRDLAWALSLWSNNDAMTGRFDACTESATEAIAIADRIGAPWLKAYAELGLGLRDGMQGHHATAVAHMRAAYDDAVASGDLFLESYTATNLALQQLLAGDAANSRVFFATALQASQRLNNRRAVAGCLEGLAYIATDEGAVPLGARLLGAAAHIRDISGAPLLPQWWDAHQARLRRQDEALGADAAARERQAGADLPLDDLIHQLPNQP